MESQRKKENFYLLLATAPALIVFIIIKIIPSISGLYYSFTNWNGIYPTYRCIGLENFKEIFTNDLHFWQSLRFTFRYVFWHVFTVNLFALLLSLAIESLQKIKGIFRTLFYLPNMISMIIGGYMWNFIFSRVLYYFADTWGWSFFDKSWIGDPSYSFYAIIVVSLWGGVGYIMIIYIASLQHVPKTLYEAAIVDGAGPFTRFFRITMPLIRQGFTISLFITLNNAFQVFDVVYSLTGGGPGRSTQVVALNIYQEAFSRSNRFGYATAKSMVLFLIILIITHIQVTIMKKREEEA